jgi:hypothetical protein
MNLLMRLKSPDQCTTVIVGEKKRVFKAAVCHRHMAFFLVYAVHGEKAGYCMQTKQCICWAVKCTLATLFIKRTINAAGG